jgi:chitodextrinase
LTSFVNNSGLTANTVYRYRVRATNTAGASPYSGIVNVTTGSVTGCTPTNFMVSGTTSTSISLSWSPPQPVCSTAGFDVFRAPGASGGTFTLLAQVTTTSYTNSGLTSGSTFRYQVRARDIQGNLSAFTPAVTATTGTTVQPPGTPGPLSAPSTTASTVNLTWGASTGTVTNYQIERCQGATCTNFVQVTTSAATSIADGGLAAATTYRYRVRAANSAGTSGYTNTVNATTTGGGGGGGCSATLTLQTGWNTGYVMQPITVTNTGTSTLNGWTVTFTLPAGHAITGSWNATVTVSGQTVTARGISGQNATLGAGASTNFGFQATRPDGNTAVPSGATCTTP